MFPVGYIFRKCKSAEMNSTVTEKGFLAVVFALKNVDNIYRVDLSLKKLQTIML